MVHVETGERARVARATPRTEHSVYEPSVRTAAGAATGSRGRAAPAAGRVRPRRHCTSDAQLNRASRAIPIAHGCFLHLIISSIYR